MIKVDVFSSFRGGGQSFSIRIGIMHLHHQADLRPVRAQRLKVVDIPRKGDVGAHGCPADRYVQSNEWENSKKKFVFCDSADFVHYSNSTRKFCEHECDRISAVGMSVRLAELQRQAMNFGSDSAPDMNVLGKQMPYGICHRYHLHSAPFPYGPNCHRKDELRDWNHFLRGIILCDPMTPNSIPVSDGLRDVTTT